ncbi:PP-loop family-domain-containing protein [Gymnopilus junonius]|uniref:tRNA(Ile)-lysidine synthetase n=1 Tax=Gymnopilus junonius TaxID=109634 RepID=A0A9P5NZN2_GYMJU|nr:PP-loop family-domain-containing protein [Gymnopilus junonius]
MAARVIQAISAPEFARMMEVVRPPSGWTETLAVANSGGPDSTALLFLLNRHIKDQKQIHSRKLSPHRLISLTVDHDLQATSAEMAGHASKTAEILGIPQITTKLAWGENGNPPKPEADGAIEEVARDLRYDVFFQNMTQHNTKVLALGHHLDDQVETMLIRLGRGSGRFGLAGMRPVRRWGMGEKRWEQGVDQRLIEGMRRWIVRPLLSVGKDRILATCEENKLDYVNDPTNFQPQLTIRNAIRHVIETGGTSSTDPKATELSKFPRSVARALADINIAAEKRTDVNFSLVTDLPTLRQISLDMTSELLDVDKKVDEFIEDNRRLSAEGSFMFSPLALKEIESPLVLEALLYRVARFVSPEPWGSPRSELGRRKTSMDRLIKHLHTFENFRRASNMSITVGSHVWFRLIEIRRNQLKTTLEASMIQNLNWLASRLPKHRLDDTPAGLHPLKRNVTPELLEWQKAWQAGERPPLFEVLYDCRFLVQFKLDEMTPEIRAALSNGAKIQLKPRGVWNVPQVVLVVKKKDRAIHWHLEKTPYSLPREWGLKMERDIRQGWITMKYFRPTSAI